MPSMHVCTFVCLSCFYIIVYISLIYEDMFTKFAENMAMKTCLSKFCSDFKKQNGLHSRLFQNH